MEAFGLRQASTETVSRTTSPVSESLRLPEVTSEPEADQYNLGFVSIQLCASISGDYLCLRRVNMSQCNQGSAQTLYSLSFPHLNQPPPKIPIWLAKQNPPVFASSSSLPCRLMKKRLASHWSNTHSPSDSRVANPSTPLPLFCKTKHRPSRNTEEAIE